MGRGSGEAIGWVLVALFAIGTFASAFVPGVAPVAGLLDYAVLLAFAIWHGGARYGRGRMLAAVAIMFALGMVLENISIHTGFPFGYFYHSDIFGPKLLDVPYMVGLLYFTLSYPGWAAANLLLGEADRDGRALSSLALPLVAMFVPPALDATFDPVGATINRAWTFVGGGGYFGVPLSNFLGIMLVNALGFVIYARYLARVPQAVTPGQSRGWWLQPGVILAIFAVAPALGMMTAPDSLATDPGGTVWRAAHIHEGLTVVSLCSIAFLAVTSILLALRRG
jgi:uncharacterized membrane protein